MGEYIYYFNTSKESSNQRIETKFSQRAAKPVAILTIKIPKIPLVSLDQPRFLGSLGGHKPYPARIIE